MSKSTEAGSRFTRLRRAGLPALITGHQAWHLSGGVLGAKGDHAGRVPLSRVALKVPDCEAFLPDYRAAVEAEVLEAEPARAPVSRYTGHRFDCPTYSTLDAADCDCLYSGAEDTEPAHPDYAWEAEYRAHSSSITGVYEAP